MSQPISVALLAETISRSCLGVIVVHPHDPAPSARGVTFLNCPRCGLSIRKKVPRRTVEPCPRCLARARIPVTLFASARPAVEWYRDGPAPYTEVIHPAEKGVLMPTDKKDNAVPATLAANVPESFAAEAYISEWFHGASEAIRAPISNEGGPGLRREDAYISEWSASL